MKKYILILILCIISSLITSCGNKEKISKEEKINTIISVNYKEKFGGDNDDYWVCIDNEKLEEISCGNKVTYKVQLPEGEHTFSMKSNVLHKSEEIVFNVSSSNTKFSFDAEGSLLAGVNVSQNK